MTATEAAAGELLMRGLVIIDPEVPEGFRRVSYGPVMNGRAF